MKVLFLFFITSLWALNKTHLSQYNQYPELAKPGRSEFQIGVVSKFEGAFNLPLAIITGLGKQFEAGFKLDFRSQGQDFAVSEVDLVMDIGLAARVDKISSVQADVLFGVGSSGHQGVVLGYTIFHGVSKGFSVTYQLKGGFLKGIADEEFMLAEALLFPRIHIFDSFDLIANLSYSNSITSPVDYSAFDIAPGAEIDLSGPNKIFFLANMGIKGAKKEGPILWEIGVRHAF